MHLLEGVEDNILFVVEDDDLLDEVEDNIPCLIELGEAAKSAKASPARAIAKSEIIRTILEHKLVG